MGGSARLAEARSFVRNDAAAWETATWSHATAKRSVLGMAAGVTGDIEACHERTGTRSAIYASTRRTDHNVLLSHARRPPTTSLSQCSRQASASTFVAELDQFFSFFPSVAEGFALRTWRGGPQKDQPKLPPPAKSLIDRQLMRLDRSSKLPRLFFTTAGMGALRQMMANRRLADPSKFAPRSTGARYRSTPPRARRPSGDPHRCCCAV